MYTLRLHADPRRNADRTERRATCRRCGARIHLLPEDRRLGYCFDCYDPSEVYGDRL